MPSTAPDRFLLFSPPEERFTQETRNPTGEMMNGLLGNLWWDDSGQDLAEYALLFALIAIVAISSLVIIGGGLNDVFTGVGNELETGIAST